MRKKIKDYLARSMFERLKRDYFHLKKLDSKARNFNGTFGFLLGRWNGANFFLTVIAHDEQDTFRVVVAWGPTENYPTSPFRDLTAGLKDYLLAASAEIQLAQLTEETVPYEFALDREAQLGASAREAIALRLQRGEAVTPEEWLQTVRENRCSVEAAMSKVDEVCEIIAVAIHGAMPDAS